MLTSNPDLIPRDVVSHMDWEPSGVVRCITSSAFFFIGVMQDGCTVLKYPKCKTPDLMNALRDEWKRYTWLKPHQNIVTCKGISEDGLLLEYCELEELLILIDGNPPLSEHERTRIARGITCGLVHIHQQKFIHCDINVHNVFVTSTMEAKIGDMQGQAYSPDGGIELPALSQETVKSRHPAAGDDEFSVRTDIFALGTLFYHLWHGHPPFPELDEFVDGAEIQARYQRGDFPVHASVASGVDRIVYQCWVSGYGDASEVLRDLHHLDRSMAEDRAQSTSDKS